MSSIRLVGLALFSIGLLATTSCNPLKKTTVQKNIPANRTEQTVAQPAVQLDALLGEWSITEALGTEIKVNGENHPKLALMQVSGSTDILRVIVYNGCNHINGDWKFSGSTIVPAGEFISSLMACPDAPYENIVNQAINSVAAYRLSDPTNLELLSSNGKVVMKMRQRNLSFLNGAWKVLSLHGRPIPQTANVRVVIDIDECKIHGEAGCNVLNGEVVVNLDKGDGIEFKNLATSRMTCPDIATEQEFLLALEEVDTAVKGSAPDEALMKDASGNVVITLMRLSPDQLTD
ncbi:MAG: META domain-containing protein [Muribaculaceae bacterium]|nr:META domain-containing protein [Muribaculaceae bacterium]